MDLGFLTREASFDGGRIGGALADLGNAVFALFWEGGEPRLGTLTITLPGRVSTSLLGERDRELGLLLGEHLSQLSGKMALVSTNLQASTGSRAGRVLIDLVRELVGALKEGEG
jgi:hypothetical protein